MAAQMLGSLDTSGMGVVHDAQLDYYGKRAACASSDHMVYISDAGEGPQKPVARLEGHEGPVWKVSWAHPRFAAGQGGLVASGGYDMKVIVWKEVSPSRWQIAHQDASHGASVNDVRFCPCEHGLRLACASSDGSVSVLTHSPADQQWRRAVFQAHAGGAQALCWAPASGADGGQPQPPRLASGGCDGGVKVWRLEGETWVQEYAMPPGAHGDWVRDVAWRPDGPRTLASGSWDKSIVIWAQEHEGGPWRQASKLELPGRVESLSWSPTGGLLCACCGDGEVMIFRASDDGSFAQVGAVSEQGVADGSAPQPGVAEAVAAAFAPAAEAPAPPPAPPPAAGGVEIRTLRAGDGVTFPKVGDLLTMHYTGTVAATGQKFDSSHDRSAPFQFKIGLGQVIEGWDKGVIQMSVGQKAVLRIPPELAYGEEGAGNGVIPPSATLDFEVELLRVN